MMVVVATGDGRCLTTEANVALLAEAEVEAAVLSMEAGGDAVGAKEDEDGAGGAVANVNTRFGG